MKTNSAIIGCELGLLLLLFQFFEKHGGHATYFGYPWPILMRWYSCQGIPDDHLSLHWYGCGTDLIVISIVFLAGWFLLKRLRLKFARWSRLAVLANIITFAILVYTNAWFALAYDPDTSKPGTTYLYNGGWPVPQFVIDRPSEDEPDRVGTAGDFYGLDLANLPIAFLLPILCGMAIHVLTTKKDVDAEQSGAAPDGA